MLSKREREQIKSAMGELEKELSDKLTLSEYVDFLASPWSYPKGQRVSIIRARRRSAAMRGARERVSGKEKAEKLLALAKKQLGVDGKDMSPVSLGLKGKRMKFHSSMFYFSKDGVACQTSVRDFLNAEPVFNRYGEKIMNPFTYMAAEVLGSVRAMIETKEFIPCVQILMTVACDENFYWVEADVTVTKESPEELDT